MVFANIWKLHSVLYPCLSFLNLQNYLSTTTYEFEWFWKCRWHYRMRTGTKWRSMMTNVKECYHLKETRKLFFTYHYQANTYNILPCWIWIHISRKHQVSYLIDKQQNNPRYPHSYFFIGSWGGCGFQAWPCRCRSRKVDKLGKGLNHFFLKNQQFITRDAVVDHGSYNETTYIKQKKEKEKE